MTENTDQTEEYRVISAEEIMERQRFLVTDGTEVVDIEGMPRQGVLIYSVGEEGEYRGLPRIFY